MWCLTRRQQNIWLHGASSTRVIQHKSTQTIRWQMSTVSTVQRAIAACTHLKGPMRCMVIHPKGSLAHDGVRRETKLQGVGVLAGCNRMYDIINTKHRKWSSIMIYKETRRHEFSQTYFITCEICELFTVTNCELLIKSSTFSQTIITSQWIFV